MTVKKVGSYKGVQLSNSIKVGGENAFFINASTSESVDAWKLKFGMELLLSPIIKETKWLIYGHLKFASHRSSLMAKLFLALAQQCSNVALAILLHNPSKLPAPLKAVQPLAVNFCIIYFFKVKQGALVLMQNLGSVSVPTYFCTFKE